MARQRLYRYAEGEAFARSENERTTTAPRAPTPGGPGYSDGPTTERGTQRCRVLPSANPVPDSRVSQSLERQVLNSAALRSSGENQDLSGESGQAGFELLDEFGGATPSPRSRKWVRKASPSELGLSPTSCRRLRPRRPFLCRAQSLVVRAIANLMTFAALDPRRVSKRMPAE